MTAWFRPRDDKRWVSVTEDGYYAVARDHMQFEREFQAFHIEALWARPAEIGFGPDLEAAQRICDEHRTRLTTLETP